MAQLDGVAFIIGAGSGLGRDVALTFAERGASTVVLADIDIGSAKSAEDESRKIATNPIYYAAAHHVDISEKESVDSTVASITKQFGRIDYAVNCAGIGPKTSGPITETPVEEIDRLHKVNSRGTFLFTAAVAAQMQQQPERFINTRSGGQRSIGKGAIVNVASLAGLRPVPGAVQYSASKFGAVGVGMNAAADLARAGVRVNTLCPSWVDTPMMDRTFERIPAMKDAINRTCPLGRMATPEEVSGAIHFLCGPDASYISGTNVVVDAGLSVSRLLA